MDLRSGPTDGDRPVNHVLPAWDLLLEQTGVGEAVAAVECSLGSALDDEDTRYRYLEVLSALVPRGSLGAT